MNHIKIIPLNTGTLKRNKGAFIMGSQAQSIEMPVLMFLIQTGDANILVDTGTRNPERTPALHNPYEQTEAQQPKNLLAKMGLCFEDIDVVINTHLHWDHCSNNDLFTKATFYVQREELRYASAPLPAHAHGYEAFQVGLIPPFAGTKFQVLEGDCRILEGVSVLFTPGHTPGSQSVLVESGNNSCIMAGDNIPFYENLKESNILKFIPSTIYVNLEEYYRSIRKILSYGFRIIPGHDIRVMSQEKFEN